MGIMDKIRDYFEAKDRNIAMRKSANRTYAKALHDNVRRTDPEIDGLGAAFLGEEGQIAGHIKDRGEAYGRSIKD